MKIPFKTLQPWMLDVMKDVEKLKKKKLLWDQKNQLGVISSYFSSKKRQF